jgi:hypothetical protein
VFEHDPGIASGVMVVEGKGFGLREVVAAGASAAMTMPR